VLFFILCYLKRDIPFNPLFLQYFVQYSQFALDILRSSLAILYLCLSRKVFPNSDLRNLTYAASTLFLCLFLITPPPLPEHKPSLNVILCSRKNIFSHFIFNFFLRYSIYYIICSWCFLAFVYPMGYFAPKMCIQ